jgi:hypothetical protein
MVNSACEVAYDDRKHKSQNQDGRCFQRVLQTERHAPKNKRRRYRIPLKKALKPVGLNKYSSISDRFIPTRNAAARTWHSSDAEALWIGGCFRNLVFQSESGATLIEPLRDFGPFDVLYEKPQSAAGRDDLHCLDLLLRLSP